MAGATYSLSDIGQAQGWFNPADERYQDQWVRAPSWAQDLMRRRLSEVYLTPEQQARQSSGQPVNPFRYGKPNPYGPQSVGYGDTASIDAYMRDNPEYARIVQADPAWENWYAGIQGEGIPASQGGAGTQLGYQWGQSQGTPVMNPFWAPWASHVHQSVQRHNWNADMLRQGINRLTGNV